MKNYKLDLHIHTVLSPCADLLMTPANILNKAEEQGIDIIAITDHNSAENVEVTLQLADNYPVHVIPGMEVETREEVHLLCYFENLQQILAWQEIVYNNLPDLKNDEEYFGNQLKTDLEDQYVTKIERLLATATELRISEVVKKVRDLGGYVIPSHVDRSYSIIKNLGFVPPDLEIELLEISKNGDISDLQKNFPYLKSYNFIRNSDSHYLKEMHPMTEVELSNMGLKSIFDKIITI